MSCNLSSEQELKVKKLKRSLDGWREIILNVHSVLCWEKNWHPSALLGISTLLFLLLWFFDPSVLTTVSSIGLLVTIGDYLVPTIAAGVFRNDLWTGSKEKKFDEICRSIVCIYTQISDIFWSFYLLRRNRPKIYYVVSSASLILLAWLGSAVNNLLLTYILVLVLLMLPGLERQGLISNYCGTVGFKMKELLKNPIVRSEKKAD